MYIPAEDSAKYQQHSGTVAPSEARGVSLLLQTPSASLFLYDCRPGRLDLPQSSLEYLQEE